MRVEWTRMLGDDPHLSGIDPCKAFNPIASKSNSQAPSFVCRQSNVDERKSTIDYRSHATSVREARTGKKRLTALRPKGKGSVATLLPIQHHHQQRLGCKTLLRRANNTTTFLQIKMLICVAFGENMLQNFPIAHPTECAFEFGSTCYQNHNPKRYAMSRV